MFYHFIRISSANIKDFSLVTSVFIFIVFVLSSVTSFPSGAPSYSCRNLIPAHSNGSQTSPPPYRVDVSNTALKPGERAKVSVASISDFPFLGFICAASRLEDANHLPVGMMSHSGGFVEKDLMKAVSCSKSDPDTAMTHTSRRDKVRVEFDWTPPTDDAPGQGYKMRCTVVQSFYRCWTGIQVNIFMEQPSTRIGSRNDPTATINTSNNNANLDSLRSQFQPPSTNNERGSSSLLNQNPNQLSDFPVSPLFQNQQDLAGTQDTFTQIGVKTLTPELLQPSSGLSFLTNPMNHIPPSSSLPFTRNTLSLFSSPPNQPNDIILPPNPNEIPAQTQSIDLGILIDLINMGIITLHDGVISFNSIQSPNLNLHTNTITHIDDPGSPQTTSQNIRGHQDDIRISSLNENRSRSVRGPNSKGIFQSSHPRPFDPNFNRIRQPHNLEHLERQ